MSDCDNPPRIMVRTNVGCEYIVRIAREITEADDFAEEFQLLASAGPNDVVKLQIITIGGRVDTAHMLCKAIRECEAHTIGYIGPMCMSSGTAIALACEEYEIDEMSSFMIHTATYGLYGKANEIKSQFNHQDKMVERFVRNTYSGFLSEEEINDCLRGIDFYFEGEELAERLQAYAEYRDERRREAVAEMQAKLETITGQLEALNKEDLTPEE